MGVTASFAQVYTVEVTWEDLDNPADCICVATVGGSYFKVTITVYDNANGEMVIPGITEYTADHTYSSINITVDDVEEYCGKDHDFTPSFTVTAWVELIDDLVNPPVICCSGTEQETNVSCHTFYNEIVPVPTVELD